MPGGLPRRRQFILPEAEKTVEALNRRRHPAAQGGATGVHERTFRHNPAEASVGLTRCSRPYNCASQQDVAVLTAIGEIDATAPEHHWLGSVHARCYFIFN